MGNPCMYPAVIFQFSLGYILHICIINVIDRLCFMGVGRGDYLVLWAARDHTGGSKRSLHIGGSDRLIRQLKIA